MEFCNEHIKAKFDKNHEFCFCVKKIGLNTFFFLICIKSILTRKTRFVLLYKS